MNDVLPSTITIAAHDQDLSVTETVVDAVATAENVSPLDLEPLARVIDPDALEELVASLRSGGDESSGTVEFPYSGYDVTVSADGNVSLDQRRD